MERTRTIVLALAALFGVAGSACPAPDRSPATSAPDASGWADAEGAYPAPLPAPGPVGAAGPGAALADPPSDSVPAPADPDAALEAHLRALRPTVPEGFTIVVEPPFVVLGDEEPQRVRLRAEHTVRWAVTLLRREYFPVDPHPALDIWLFKDEESYRRHAEELFGDRPDTPYGYYSDEHRALVMNIATGDGTLVHEIVHPYVEANFPACPAWFNEGLGSLYEAGGERDGHIVGLVNWRLPGLQEALAAGEVVSIEALTHTTTDQFYGVDSGLYYAMARYLCLYLQERGRLARYYREFLAHQAEDPTGYETLLRVMEIEDVSAFEDAWHAWVAGLHFPPS